MGDLKKINKLDKEAVLQYRKLKKEFESLETYFLLKSDKTIQEWLEVSNRMSEIIIEAARLVNKINKITKDGI